MDDSRTDREGGGMRVSRFRFSVTSLLILMLLVANACLGWRVYQKSRQARLMRQLEIERRDRDVALQNWKDAANTRKGFATEAACRGQYFESRDAVKTALKRLGVNITPATNN